MNAEPPKPPGCFKFRKSVEIRCSPGAALKGNQEREYEKFNRKRNMGGNFELVKRKLTHPARCLLPPLRFVGVAA